MATLHDFLKEMVERGASDLHITAGVPPMIRVRGELIPLDYPPLKPQETRQLCYSVLTDAQKHRFEEDHELDLSFGVKGLSRFRSNIYLQRGALAGAFRLIPYQIRSFEELGLPPVVNELSAKPRADTGHGSHGLREIYHTGGHDRQDQYYAASAHNDH